MESKKKKKDDCNEGLSEGVFKRPDSSRRKIKRARFFYEDETPTREHRACEKAGCRDPEPNCCLQASGSCTRDGYTSRWYHMSLGEHFCNDCFDHFYRPTKGGFKEYSEWNRKWFLSSHIKPTLKRFVAEEAMPYWFQCTDEHCGKWREVRVKGEPKPHYIANFKCDTAFTKWHQDACTIVEEQCVSDLSNPNWTEQLVEIPFLKKSPAGPYLPQFYPEGIGLCPIDCSTNVMQIPEHIEPFREELNGESPIWINPDVMETEEIQYMPPNVINSSTYLGLRNLIIAIWTLSPGEWVTLDKTSSYMLCRGLIRIYLLSCCEKIIQYLTHKGVINFGLVSPIVQDLQLVSSENVVIIGAGAAGLSAAQHLHKFGIPCTILEASSHVGGRVRYQQGLPLGAHFIPGVINNPLTILSHQAKLKVTSVYEDHDVLLNDDGILVTCEVLEKVLCQFTGILEGALQSAAENKQDSDWFSTIRENQQDFHEISSFSPEEDSIFEFLLKYEEITERCALKHQTLLNWEKPKSIGPNGIVEKGLQSLLMLLGENLDIQFNKKVTSIDYNMDEVCIKTNDGNFTATRVIVTVPIPVLQKQMIKFVPPLPGSKLAAIQEFQNITYEKVFLQFPECFWHSIIEERKMFSVISSKTPFQCFFDVTDITENNMPTLVTFITDMHAEYMKERKDKQIISDCMQSLRNIFSKKEVKIPEPSHSFITHWAQDSNFGASGSTIKVGSTFELYDEVAEDIENVIYFAGEGTYRKCPNSVSGAVLSGIREALKIVHSVLPIFSKFPST